MEYEYENEYENEYRWERMVQVWDPALCCSSGLCMPAPARWAGLVFGLWSLVFSLFPFPVSFVL